MISNTEKADIRDHITQSHSMFVSGHEYGRHCRCFYSEAMQRQIKKKKKEKKSPHPMPSPEVTIGLAVGAPPQ